MSDAVLTLNAGSSSIKFALFRSAPGLSLLSHGQIEGIGTTPHFRATAPSGEVLAERRWQDGHADHEALLGTLLDWVSAHLGADALVAVGHRVVHGGPDHDRPQRVTEALLAELDRLCPLAPLHQPHNIAPIRVLGALRPELAQVVCFDTAFHHGMPLPARRVALPREYEAEGVRRYGFHGLSYEYIANRLRETAPAMARGRVIVAHLGNGASLCAMRDGRSIDTTMGFTALDGLVMGTRCGTLDPGILLYLQRTHEMDAERLEQLLYERSGLLGVSGLSSDMRVLMRSTDTRAREAIALFVFRLAREAGALVSSLGGLDALVFTAGIGENTPAIRSAACERLAWLGVALDEDANARGAERISLPGSRIEVRVMATDEEGMIARHTIETVGARPT